VLLQTNEQKLKDGCTKAGKYSLLQSLSEAGLQAGYDMPRVLDLID